MEFQPTTLRQVFTVPKIVTVHYFEFQKDYSFTGERHDFWELVYVDKGEVDILSDTRWRSLRQGELTFHPPGEFHNIRANGVCAPNVVIVSFFCSSRHMGDLPGRTFHLDDRGKAHIAQMVREAGRAFSSPLGDPFSKGLERADPQPYFGGEQLIRLSLEQLLIELKRSDAYRGKNTTVLRRNEERDVTDRAIRFLEQRVGDPITFEQVRNHVKTGRTTLKEAFRRRTGMGVMAYFSQLKIERAKTLIREDRYNVTQIAALLGFDTVHYFSRKFKQHTGMSPTQYARSVKIEFEEDQ